MEGGELFLVFIGISRNGKEERGGILLPLSAYEM